MLHIIQHVSYMIDGNKCQVKHITDQMQDRCIPGNVFLSYANTYTKIYNYIQTSISNRKTL